MPSGVYPRPTLPVRLFGRFDRNENGCWLYTGPQDRHGYGKISEGNIHKGTFKTYAAHRLAYTLTKGEIPKGLQIDHLCANPTCIRPSHLSLCTGKENMRRHFERTGGEKRAVRNLPPS